MVKFLAIMAGGGLGATLRYAVFQLAQRPTAPDFPFGTLVANLLGCFLIGFLWSAFEGTRLPNEWRLFIFTGFLGGFTTFSTFARETTQLMKVGEWKTALAYITISNTAGIVLVAIGYLLAKKIHLFTR
ncbi:MAG: fluoride efflux transporter CrcB [Desulfobulbaceae bacterium]|nr:fluoride efflux transporter CrcB [Desulfobulbaceae bacterium]HIJ78669.1 fluoride efflux transporter CrcB [Deltaproteobacteria bacterium]